MTKRERKAVQALERTQQRQQQIQIAGITMSGPLPPPQQLAGYDAIVPGAAERILQMAERQATHRQGLERTALDGALRRSSTGMRTATGLAAGFLVVSAALIASGHDAAGAALGTVDFVGMVTAFIYGTASGRSERLRRARILTGQGSEDDG